MRDFEDTDNLKRKLTYKNRTVVWGIDPWPTNEIHYRIDSDFSASERATIAKAMLAIETLTCVAFSPKNQPDNDFISIAQNSSLPYCKTDLGYTGGQQELLLGEG